MTEINLIDTFTGFSNVWKAVADRDVETQLNAWQEYYSKKYPFIYDLIVNDYEADKADWRTIARDRIFPLIGKKFDEIILAHAVAEDTILEVQELVSDMIKDKMRPIYIIIIGLGNGAGWAAALHDKPAVIIGLENVVDLGWHTKDAMKGLILHEVGHIYQRMARLDNMQTQGTGPFWRLYEEGFAQYFEYNILGSKKAHQSTGQKGWEKWCSKNLKYLARRFLSDIGSQKGTRNFFASWYNIDGWKETGYFLGEYIMEKLKLPIQKAACIESERINEVFKKRLERLS